MLSVQSRSWEKSAKWLLLVQKILLMSDLGELRTPSAQLLFSRTNMQPPVVSQLLIQLKLIYHITLFTFRNCKFTKQDVSLQSATNEVCLSKVTCLLFPQVNSSPGNHPRLCCLLLLVRLTT